MLALNQIIINISSESKSDKGYNKVSTNERSTTSKGKKRIYIPKKEENKRDNTNSNNNFDIRTKDSFQ